MEIYKGNSSKRIGLQFCTMKHVTPWSLNCTAFQTPAKQGADPTPSHMTLVQAMASRVRSGPQFRTTLFQNSLSAFPNENSSPQGRFRSIAAILSLSIYI
jgi:hypothetical protein